MGEKQCCTCKEIKPLRMELANRIVEYLRTHPCVDCGETNPVVLEFDHLRDKVDNVSTLVRRLSTWAVIEAEIEKCEVVCANCHRMRTAQRAGTYR